MNVFSNLAIKKWDEKSYVYKFVYKLFHKIPIKNALNEINTIFNKRLETNRRLIQEELPLLESAFKIIYDTHYSFDNYCEFLKEADRRSYPSYNPLQNKNEAEISDILNKILTVHEVVERYNLPVDRNTKNILIILNRISDHFAIYDKVIKENLNQVGKYPELISLINANIRNQKIKRKLIPIIERYVKYLSCNTNFIDKAKNINFQEIKNILSKVSVTTSATLNDIELQKIDELLELLNNCFKGNFFSEYFYNIDKNENILDWHERIENIIYFQNRQEFDFFINQNQFIAKIKELLGKNSQIIDDFLKNDNVSYEDFAQNIINALVQAKFNTFSQKERPKIHKDYFKNYKQLLSNNRKNYLLKGLKKLVEYTESARQNMKHNKNWTDRTGKNIIEKLRKNTILISGAFPIIIATPQEIAKYISAEKELFDYVIFDEASQLLPGQALPSIYRARKTIID